MSLNTSAHFAFAVTGLHWSGELNNTTPVPGKELTPEQRPYSRFESGRVGAGILRRCLAWGSFALIGVRCLELSTVSAAEVAPKFLGSQSCGTTLCHGGADEMHNQFVTWSRKDVHTRAPVTLTFTRSARIAEDLGIPPTHERCTICHDPFKNIPAERKGSEVGKNETVSCENCHNAAENWILTHTRTNLTTQQKINAGLRGLTNLYVRANTCIACHQNLDPALRKAGHPELIFELDGQSRTMPPHWKDEGRIRGAQAWLVGQAVALREAAAQSASANATDEARQRAAALAWLLGVAAEAKTADELAQDVAQQNWTEAEVRARLEKLAATPDSFARDVNVGEAVQRAERLTLGLERLLVALNLHTNTNLSPKIGNLFTNVQSRPEFSSATFAEGLKGFAAELNRVPAR
jgi:hypothetical protein